MSDSIARMKAIIVSCLESQVGVWGPLGAELPDTFNFISEGVIDSFGFVQLLADLEDRLGLPVDLSSLDPDDLTVLGPLAAHLTTYGLLSIEGRRR